MYSIFPKATSASALNTICVVTSNVFPPAGDNKEATGFTLQAASLAHFPAMQQYCLSTPPTLTLVSYIISLQSFSTFSFNTLASVHKFSLSDVIPPTSTQFPFPLSRHLSRHLQVLSVAVRILFFARYLSKNFSSSPSFFPSPFKSPLASAIFPLKLSLSAIDTQPSALTSILTSYPLAASASTFNFNGAPAFPNSLTPTPPLIIVI